MGNFLWRNCKRYKALFWKSIGITEICYFFDVIEIWWFYNTSTANGRRLSLENWLKSVIFSHSLKSVHFPYFNRFHWNLFILFIFHKDTLNGMAFDWKNYSFSPEEALLISSKKSLENLSIWHKRWKAISWKLVKICSFQLFLEISWFQWQVFILFI